MKPTIPMFALAAALASAVPSAASGPAFTLTQSISDEAQRTTLAFDGLAIMTGNLDAQSFFPPGKVADYTGFQYLRDNDPDNMGHNTSFLTRVANNVIYVLDDAQFAQLSALAVAQQSQIDLYGYKRYPLMKAFRRLLDGDVPAGSSGLDLAAVKAASRELYLIDGEISFDRALLYANILASMSAGQKAYLDGMKGKGWNSWPNVTDAQVRSRMQTLPQGTAVAVMTYASDLYSWYAGSVDADVYFCPERHGTYYGGFYIKDAPAVGHEGYSISEQLTATAGAALCDAAKGYVTQAQAAQISSLVDLQRNNLYADATSIVGVRTQIATLLRGLLVSTASSASVKSQVLALSGTYGELDGEDNYAYATVFAQVYATLSAAQKANLAALRTSIMSGTYSDGTAFDDSVCTTPFLYSAVIPDPSVLDPYVADTDYLFAAGTPAGTFTLMSDAGTDGGTLPAEYSCDGAGDSPALAWSNAPAGTAQFAVMMTTLPGDGTTKWNWVLYDIPGTASALARNGSGGGVAGVGSDDTTPGYEPPCSQGPGPKAYTFTVYALSAAPQLPPDPSQVTGPVLTQAIAGITLSSASITLTYTRPTSVLAAAFTFAPSAPAAGQTVSFTDASTGAPTLWSWQFGDGASSTAQNPTHTYAAGGSYAVVLTVANSGGQRSISHTVTVTPAAASSYARWIPSVSHVQGTGGTQWRSDVALLNPGAAAAGVQVLLYTSGGVVRGTASVPAASQLVLTDVAGGLGVNGSGALAIVSDQPLVVASRTYDQLTRGTLGQGYASLPVSAGLAAGQSAWLPQLAQNAEYRTNIALTNTGDTTATVSVTLFGGDGTELVTYGATLAPGEWSQDIQPYLNRAGRTDVASGFARVTVTSGAGVIATASVTDNVTNDPTTVAMVAQ